MADIPPPSPLDPYDDPNDPWHWYDDFGRPVKATPVPDLSRGPDPAPETPPPLPE